MRKFLAAAAAAALLFASPAAGIPPLPPPAQPKLVIAITLDGVSPEILNAYRPLLTSGLARVGSGSPVPGNFHAAGASSSKAPRILARSIDDGQPDQRFYWSGSGFVSDFEHTCSGQHQPGQCRHRPGDRDRSASAHSAPGMHREGEGVLKRVRAACRRCGGL